MSGKNFKIMITCNIYISKYGNIRACTSHHSKLTWTFIAHFYTTSRLNLKFFATRSLIHFIFHSLPVTFNLDGIPKMWSSKTCCGPNSDGISSMVKCRTSTPRNGALVYAGSWEFDTPKCLCILEFDSSFLMGSLLTSQCRDWDRSLPLTAITFLWSHEWLFLLVLK